MSLDTRAGYDKIRYNLKDMKTRKLLCDICKVKIRKAEAKYKKQRRHLKIKLKADQVSGKIKIKKLCQLTQKQRILKEIIDVL